MLGITNWKTTVSALPAVIGAAVNIYTALKHGTSPEANEWGVLGAALSAILIGISAKDKNVTGGTVPQSVEAEHRALSPPIPAGK